MSEIGSGNNDLPIQISPSRMEIKNQSQRKDKLLEGKQITRLGENDPTYRQVIFLDKAFQEMIDYGMSDRKHEVAGILSGFHQGDQTIITRFMPSREAEGTAGQVNITESAWAHLIRENDRRNAMERVTDDFVAWFHTHPVSYPPEPQTTGDQFIMRNYFSQSGKQDVKDMTTVIMTTFGNSKQPSIAAWKWDGQQDEAVWMKGISIAHKGGKAPDATYYRPASEMAQRWGEPKEKTHLTMSDIFGDEPITDDGISIIKDADQQTIHIALTDKTDSAVRIILKDLDPDPDVLHITLEDLSIQQTEAIERHIKEYPNKKESGFLRKLLGSTRKRSHPVEDDITILPDDR